MAIPAGVISVAGSIAVIAFFEMATEGRGAADLDGAQDTLLFQWKLVSFPICVAVLSKNIGHFKSGPGHPELFPGLRFLVAHQSIERTGRTGNHMRRYLGIARRGFDTAMAEQSLNDAGIGSTFQQMRGEGVA